MSVSKQLIPLVMPKGRKKLLLETPDEKRRRTCIIRNPYARLEDLLEPYCEYRHIHLISPDTTFVYRASEWDSTTYSKTSFELHLDKTTPIRFFSELAKMQLESLMSKQPVAIMMRLEHNKQSAMAGWDFTLMTSVMNRVVFNLGESSHEPPIV
jgi:hypothetical protein